MTSTRFHSSSRKPTSNHLVSWSSVKSLRSTWCSRLEWVSVASVDCILSMRRYRSTVLIMLIVFFLILSKTALHCFIPRICFPLAPGKLSWRTSLPKISDLKIHRTLTPVTTMSGVSKIENNCRTERNVAVNLGQPASGTDRQGYERISKATEGLWTLQLGWTQWLWYCEHEFVTFSHVVWITLFYAAFTGRPTFLKSKKVAR